MASPFRIIWDFLVGQKAASQAIAIHHAFRAASDAYTDALNSIEAYTARAHNRYTLMRAARYVLAASAADREAADAAYDEARAVYTDPDDRKPYTEADLDAHTAAMNALSTTFDSLVTAFDAVNRDNDLYASAVALFEACRDTYVDAAKAYRNAAFCAMTNALDEVLQALKDKIEAGGLELYATHNPAVTNRVAAKAEAATAMAKATERGIRAEALKQKAKDAEARAERFLAKAGAAKTDAATSSEEDR